MITLDLGCGGNPKNPYQAREVWGIDFNSDPDKNIKGADLAIDPIPFPDNYFNFVTAYDLIEHIPRVLYVPTRRNPFIELMSEIFRVLKPDGFFYSHTPAFPHAAAFMDPTHVNIITEGTFGLYFGDTSATSPWGVIYGFKGQFKLVEERWDGPHLATLLQKK